MDKEIDRAQRALEILEIDLAAQFSRSVEAILRQLTDREINTLFLMTHTPWAMGDDPGSWIAVLMPLIERESDLRRDISIVPYIGPFVAPELYQKGGAHDLPF